MKFIRGLIALLTIGVITNVAGAWVLDSTLFSSSFILERAQKADFFTQATKALPEFMRQSPDKETRANAEVIAAVVTPAYVETKFSDYLTQLEARYRDEGPKPQLDLTDLGVLAQKDGFHLPAEAIDEPVTLGDPISPERTKFFFTNLNWIKFGGIGLGILMLGLVWLAADSAHRYKSVFKTLLGAAIGLLPNWLFFYFAPGLAVSALNNDVKTKALAPALGGLIQSVFRGTAAHYLMAAAVLAILAFSVLAARLVLKGKSRKAAAPKRRRPKDEGGLIPQP